MCMCVDGTVTPFCTGKSGGVEGEITPEEPKREYARRRYLEMTYLAKHTRI